MGIREIIMLYLTTYFTISVLLTECVSSILRTRYQHILAKIPVTFKLMLVVLYLTSIVTARAHEPQVYEELEEEMPEVIRRVRHSDTAQTVYQPPVFNYRTAKQQDRMKSRYHRQQQIDFHHLNIKPINPDEFFELNQRYIQQNRETPMNVPIEQSDWKPFQPNYITPSKVKTHLEVVGKNRFTEIKKNRDTIEVFEASENDLDSAGSENTEDTVEQQIEVKLDAAEKTDRGDDNARYIYVQPDILKNNFGMDQKAVQAMLRNGATSGNAEEIQISELQGLLGKNPEYQLQGLQKLLEDARPVMSNLAQNHLPPQEETEGIEIKPNSLPNLSSNQPPIDDLQQHLDAVNKAHADAALAAAQKQAEAHVRAQHDAIALAQKQAEEEALAKIAAHNQGRTIIDPSEHLQVLDGVMPDTAAPLVADNPRPQMSRVEAIIQQIEQNSVDAHSEKAEESVGVANVDVPNREALNGRPYEQVLLHQSIRDDTGYAPRYTDIRNNKPIINISAGKIPEPTPFAKIHTGPPLIQPLEAVPEIYSPDEIQNYARVPHNTPSFDPQDVHPPIETSNLLPVQQTKSTYIPLASPAPSLEEHGHDSYQEVNIDTHQSHPAQKHLYSEEKHEQYDDVHQYAANYAFGYRILDEKHGNDYGHEEKRNGKFTKGHYFVLLPDGRRQKVDYVVDNSGYHAKVTYENVGRHPKFLPHHPQEHLEHHEESEDVHK